MVAISLYKGNLHRATDTPRQWLMPTRKISLKDFKTLLHRRSRALARLQSIGASTSNPNPNLDNSNGSLEAIVKDASALNLVDEFVNSNADENGKKESTGDDNDWSVIPSDEVVAREVADAKAVLPENDSNDGLQQEEKTEYQLAPPKDDSLNEKEKRKKVVEQKLQILNERKHKLVQVLKQILNAEEELRRRSNVQGITGRPSVSLQVDVTNDSGSMSRHVTPRPGSEGADVGGADADDVSNHNMHSRNMTRMSSMSPSSDSLHRRAPFSMVPNPSRGIVASSPSRFAPTSNGQQQGGNLPSVSVTGTNYVASSPSPSPSPSPAGSGGTSVFRDAIASPWN
ncbi:hypothetical protein L1987_23389 [Smallanthus sonchifolius]|uniref:Uncharacterized protein n=1 Tax=Smallanthus sonchifolius TaxID=185202 RepID=A0ACB9IIZ7_9ASTR|nr:hypothetical protein L1987_23389 [Smallanthus sonchifolius]